MNNVNGNLLSVSDIREALMRYSDPKRSAVHQRFFKTEPGGYGEGDIFIGASVPDVRKVAKEFRDISFELIEELLESEIHECRECALYILVGRFKKKKCERTAIYEFYLAHTDRINNWDLVDVSCPSIVGGYLLDKPRDILYQLLDNQSLWERRISIISCLALIRNGDFDDIFRLTERLLDTDKKPHDLMQKACGWALREVGKHGGMERLESFLEMRASTMPRTMLRYAIEKMDAGTRQYYMCKRS